MTDEVLFRSLTRSCKPNQFFAVPSGHVINRPHCVSNEYHVDAATLFDAIRAIALAEPRTRVMEEDRDSLGMELCQRSALFRFPDDISVRVLARGEGRATLAIYSRARYGYSDFGVNARRVGRWLDALDSRFAH